MGFRCRWLASRRPRAEILKQLGFVVSEEINEAVYDTGLWAVGLADRWTVVMGDGWDFMDSIGRKQAEAVSAGGEAIFFYTDDSPMCCEIAAFRDGRELWSLAYDGSDGVSKPKITGTPPEIVSNILAEV